MLREGQVVELEHVFTQAEIDRFAALSGDDNPIHVDPEFAAQSRFGRTVCHGMLLYGFVDSLIRRHFRHVTTIEQQLMFPTPTYTGERVTVRAEVAAVIEDESRARIETVITRPGGDIACQGEASVTWRSL